MKTKLIFIASALFFVIVAGCAKNPVTGKNQLMLVSEAWELDVGKKYYSPMRQSQGGDYTVDPEVERYVRKVGLKLSAVSDRNLPYEFNVINDSTPNAWALPGGKISINRGLLIELESEAELAAVLGHEIVHAAAKHGASAQTRGVGAQLVTVGAVIGLSGKIGGEAAQLLGVGASQLVNQSYGRKAEKESDEYGMLYMKRAGYDVRGAIGLQQKFVKLSQAQGEAGKFQQLFSSHPSSEARVTHNRNTAAKMGIGGEVGKERYKQKMSRMLKAKPAYDNYDKAKSEFSKGRKQQAQSLLKKAIAIEPKEALFHSALGDIAADNKNFAAAKSYYDKAIGLNKQYYYPFLKRGEALYQAGNYGAASKDLKLSNKMLPSGAANNLLGNVSQKTNNLAGAKQYFKEAVKYGGQDASTAYSKLLVLDLDKNPNQYLKISAGLTPKGTLGVKISNPTPKPIGSIVFAITSGSSGKTQNRRVPTTLAAGKSTVVDIGMSITKNQLQDVKVKILAAKLAR